MSENKNAQIIRSIYENFNRGDLNSILNTLAPDFKLIDLGIQSTFHGTDGFLQWLKPWEEGIPDGKAHLQTVISEGDLVITQHAHRGNHTGPFSIPLGVFQPSGQPLEAKFTEVFNLKDGKITTWTVYWDLLTFLNQMGIKFEKRFL